MAATAIITGGTGGLGAAVTTEFIGRGWRVVVPWVAEQERDRLQSLPELASAGDRLLLVRADLFDAGEVAGVAELAGAEPNAPLGAVINLVGGFAMHGRIHETPIETFEQQLRLNLRPTYLVSAAALPSLLERGEGAIVCVSTRAALRPFAGAAGYITAKAAVLAFVDALAAEYT
ncbi:MAG TPA: SDR family NAD(P)-dependent oxidoreductase, partial [Solirubrobacteraceae bacterium]|nr:SDR family NAD(P)-dependent oxidoreductase [Solirubrobacteraceae bacterium]